MNEQFTDWLKATGVSDETVRTSKGYLKRTERVYGNLDQHWEDDQCSSILAELEYTADDKRTGKPNPSKFDIDGDIYNNLSSFRSHLNSYIRFKESDAESDPEAGDETSEDVEARRLTFDLEADLQIALRSNISQLSPDLEIADGGNERKVESGYIDILARDANGAHVVIELKAVKAPESTLAQILAYMADVEEADQTPVRGIIVAPEFHQKLKSAIRKVPDVKLFRYHFEFSFERE